MNLFHVLDTGAASFSVMIFTLLTSFLTAYIGGKILHLDRHTTTLIGAGTAICGGSAIAAVAPVIGAKDKDIAFSISPDHPYVKEHPEWFSWNEDGSVKFAENPPKK